MSHINLAVLLVVYLKGSFVDGICTNLRETVKSQILEFIPLLHSYIISTQFHLPGPF